MNEQILYSDENVSISRSRIVLSGTTYAVANITSVRAEVVMQPGGFVIGALLVLAALIAFIASSPVWGILLLMAGALSFFLVFQLIQHRILFHTAAGEIQAFSSRDKSYIDKIVDAINDAIVSRG